MGNSLGSGVSRVLDPAGTGFTEVVWQQGKPPCDAELNLLQEIAADWTRKAVMRGTPSGWLGNDTDSSEVFVTNAIWSNWFQFGRQRSGEKNAVQWAVVNGWVIPVTGTNVGSPPGNANDTDTWNRLTLDPPPANSGGFREDFAFLEVWLARVPPTPLDLNKPGASYIYRYGNVEGGASYIGDDLVDPALGFETTQRVQLQYRVRVVTGPVGLAIYPDGFDPSVVKAKGAYLPNDPTAVTSYTFENMREKLGDPGLWRAGDGTANALGSVDGYVYAIPIAAVFRRNAVAWSGDSSPNLNGAFNRNPTAVDRTGAKTFSVSGIISDPVPAIPTLASAITAASTTIQLDNLSQLNYLPLPLAPTNAVLIQVGDELMTYSGITTGGVMSVTRGVNGTRAEYHPAGSTIKVLSGRPDGLFSDQIAKTDILDLRHVVTPNGFDYGSVLKSNLDKLLRGKLHANWKRTNFGPQGPFLFYEDKLGVSAGTGITLLDAPDNIRMVFSDSASVQKVQFIAEAGSGGPAVPIGVTWDLGGLSIYHTLRATSGQFSPTDTITIPVAQFKAGILGGDADQIRFVTDSIDGAVEIWISGETEPVSPTTYSVTASPNWNTDLVITLGSDFPVVPTGKQLYITVSVLYGPGRGLSRRPDAIHAVRFANVGNDVLTHHSGFISTQFPLRTAWAPLWSKFRSSTYQSMLPVTAEAYADLGSKTLILQPFRKIAWPDLITIDGTSANYNPALFTAGASGTAGVTNGTPTFTDATQNFGNTGLNIQVGTTVVITNGVQPGNYTVRAVAPGGDNTKLTLDRAVPTAINLNYSIHASFGLMPKYDSTGALKSWGDTDPLGVFSGQSETNAATKNIYVTLPRHLVPGWGEFRLPIITTYDETQNPTFNEGINFGLLSLKGASPFSDSDKNFVPYGFVGSTCATFSTWDFLSSVAATYNTAFTAFSLKMAGIRKFTDSRGLGREGLELPPFYGIARLFAVYERHDYADNQSAYDANTRAPLTGRATNLLRQDFDGPAFWVEIDSDGDSTFVLNADMIDTTRSTYFPISSFADGEYVIEASIFGFDRGSFDLTQDFRLVLTRPDNVNTSRSQAADPVLANRYVNNVGVPVSGPVCVLPGPVGGGGAVCSVLIDYSRTPYMGDAWGTQTANSDLSYTPGPMLTGNAWQVANPNNGLTIDSLTRPNQKVLEVLASCGFVTTMGTGRISGEFGEPSQLDIRNAGYEDPTAYPPTSGSADRPKIYLGAFQGETGFVFPTIGIGAPSTDYLGCTERLPLGSLWRDKDFRGGSFGWDSYATFVYAGDTGIGLGLSMTRSQMAEYSEINLSTASLSSGQPSEFVVHVDGEQGNYSLRTNYRVNRGGSAFMASGDHPGGEVGAVYRSGQAPGSHTNVLVGRAYLVRNTVTDGISTELSAGDELMMLVTTTVRHMTDNYPKSLYAMIGTNGTLEGYSASDLYRIEGHPLVNDRVRMDIDPETITLARKAT